MKKRLYPLLAIIMVLALVLSACGGKAPEGSSDTNSDQTDQTSDKVYEFNLHNFDAPTGPTAQFLDAWAAKVYEDSNGRIKVNCFHGGSMGGPKDTYPMVINGTVELGWSLANFYPGQFPATEAITLPFIGVNSAMQGSYAQWELYDSTDYLKPEWKDVKMILLHTNNDSPIMTKKKKIEKVEDLKGLNVRVNGGPPTEFIKLAGASPFNMAIGEIYTSMEKGVIDAATSIGWDAVAPFKIHEQGKYFLDYAIHVSPYFFIMNKQAYESLPDDLKAVIDKNSGYGALEICGDLWSKGRAASVAAAEEVGEVYTISDEEMAKFKELGVKARETWAADLKAKGIDADGLVKKVEELLEKHKDK